MRQIFILVVFLFISFRNLNAQTPSSRNKPVNPTISPLVPNPHSVDLSDTANENRLVELALKGPEYDASVHQNRINDLELKRAKGTWLNLLSISTNYNDQSFAKQPTGGGQASYVYPKYFFGVTIPLGIIFSQGNQVKTARESIANGKDNQEILARTLRANVLAKYKQYKLYASLIEMESELMNDVLANSAQTEQNFKQGTITVDIYIAAQRTKNDETAKILNLQLSQDLVRLDIERMIGMPLEIALHPLAIGQKDR